MRRLAVALAIGLGLLAPAAAAQEVSQPIQPALNLLTLDKERVYRQSLSGARIEAQFQAENEALAAENRKIEAELSAEEARLTVQRPTMSAEAFATLAEDFDAKVERIRAEQQSKAEKLVADRDAGRKDFFSAAIPVLAELMRQEGAYAILNRGAVILSFDAIDITDRAIAAIDAKLGDGTKPAP